MPRKSTTENVRKICGCVKWKTCAHPWYVDYREGKVVDPTTGKVKACGLRKRLGPLVGREPKDYADAVHEARRAIVAWKDGRDPKQLQPSDDPTLATLLEAYVKERPQRSIWQWKAIARHVVGARPLGAWRLSQITTEAIRQFQRQRPRTSGNRDLALLRAAFNWAIATGLLRSSPFRIENVPIIRLHRLQARNRRLQPGESERLLEAATGLLRDVVVAALETGARRGELLSLQWWQVRFSPRAEIFLSASKTKTKRDRRVPMSSVLRDVLERRRLDPAGASLPPDAFVFGDEVGRRRQTIKDLWKLALMRAKIEGLHFHDLRREAGSRWMDAGVPLATIQRWLGHTNIAQTSTYLGASLGADELDMQAFEARIGRTSTIVDKPLTHVDVSGGSNGSQPTRTDIGVIEKTQQNPIGHEPTGVIH